MSSPDLNFARAEYVDDVKTEQCEMCSRVLDREFFTVEDRRVCRQCAEHARSLSPTHSRAVFWRSTVTGALAAAMLGTIYFILFRATRGAWMMFAAIGVGFFVGKAMRLSSGGLGGRRYQVMAALLTYAAVALGSALAMIGTDVAPVWLWPLALLAPFAELFTGHAGLAALQLLFCFVGMRWAWMQMAGDPWKITGPHPLA